MPRSKNPNPRQVMEENGMGGVISHELQVADRDDTAMEHETRNDRSQTPEGHSLTTEKPWSSDEGDGKKKPLPATGTEETAATCKSEGGVLLAECTDTFQADEFKLKSEASDGDEPNHGDLHIKPKTSFSFSPSSPPSFFAISSITSSRPSKANGLQSTAQNDGRKAKCSSPNTVNPNVMTWMRNRFQMRPGGRISASDIIELYDRDTKHLEIPPPGLQNYQVGQLLRRVFPSITRCKITVNGRRHWVYKHLNLVKNPPDNLFKDRASPAPELRDSAAPVAEMLEDTTRAPESPVSNFEEMDAGNETNTPSPLSVVEDATEDEDGKGMSSNAILLGLLGKKLKSEPVSPPPVLSNSLEMCKVDGASVDGEDVVNILPKKKRDSEVIQWLRENYKIKPGYYVKSMDLLRKYNNGRAEMVKYLSQVGRVMKNVFPSVRHLRKSFKGGKREWVYLNLKPVDVDSDSEEGKSMMMPTMRRSLGWSGNTTGSAGNADLESRQERLNATRQKSFQLSQTSNTVFKSTAEVFHRISRTDGSKLVIRRSLPPRLEKRSHMAKMMSSGDTKCEMSSGISDLSQSAVDKPVSEKRVILYNKQDSDNSRVLNDNRVPTDLEQDIFAPFNKARQSLCAQSATHSYDEKVNFDERLETSPKTAQQGSQLLVDGGVPPLLDGRRELGDDQGVSGLDLTIKKVWSAKEDDVSDGSFRPRLVEVDEGQHPLNLTLASSKATATSVAAGDAEIESSQTIHYKPSNSNALLQPTIASDRHTISSSAPPNLRNLQNVDRLLSIKRKYLGVHGNVEDAPVSWQTLQSFSAQRYGWLRSPDSSTAAARIGGGPDGKGLRFVEWFLFSGQWLVNKQRALREIKIYEDWTVAIHALGRRVYPNDLGGITDLEKTTTSLNKVFRVLAEAKLCMGFSAPSVSDLYIHGILVSKFEVWSSREGSGEDIRQRAVNCQILYSGLSNCCNKCARILKLYQQQSKGQSFKRPYTDQLASTHFRSKKVKI